MLKGQRSSLFLIGVGTIAFGWLIFVGPSSPSPTPLNPLLIYSNQTGDNLHTLVLTAISKAKESVDILSFGLSDYEVIKALNCRSSSHSIHITTDRKFRSFLKKELSPTISQSFPKQRRLVHKKALIVDDHLTWIGSANFTKPSLCIHDNLMVGIYSSMLAEAIKDAHPQCEVPLQSQILTLYSLPEAKDEALFRLLELIENASQSIVVGAFALTHPGIVQSLIHAHEKGVSVSIYLERTQYQTNKNRSLRPLIKHQVPIFIHRGAQLFHHKLVLIDYHTLVFGSANLTKSAFNANADMLLTLSPLTLEQQALLSKLEREFRRECTIPSL
ncbi:MAG: Cardiolipin synthase A [Chlamydiia bacterium]|nr:Cardiolipin synthase A [Chlamydiia bacterium]